MKKLLAMTCLILSTSVFAANADSVAACQKAKLDQSEQNQCIASGANAARITACTKARFLYAEDFQSCLILKGKTEKIDPCVRASLSSIEELKECIQ